MTTDQAQVLEGGVPRRHELMKLWQLLLAVVVAHAIAAVVLSPGIFTKDDTSPDGLLAKARDLAAEEKYQEALKAYQTMLLKKPQIPAIFVEAEKEMQGIRLKALEAQKAAAEKAAAESETSGDGEEPGTPGEKPGTPGEKPATPTTPGEKPPTTPDVNLPSLPEIGGEL